MKIKHALYFAVAFIAIAVLLVGDGQDGPLARMQEPSSPNAGENSSAPAGSPGASQLASSNGEGFAYEASDSEFDTEIVEDLGFEYYGDEDLSAQVSDEDAETPARPSRKNASKYIIPRDNPPVVLRHSGPRIDREESSTIERNAAEF